MMFSVPAGNSLVFADSDGVLLDVPLTTARSRIVASPPPDAH